MSLELLGFLYMWRHSVLAHHVHLRAMVLRYLELPPKQWERRTAVECAALRRSQLDYCEYVHRDGDGKNLAHPCAFTISIAPPAAGWKPSSRYTVQLCKGLLQPDGEPPHGDNPPLHDDGQPWSLRWHLSTAEWAAGGTSDDTLEPLNTNAHSFIGAGYVLPFDVVMPYPLE